MDDEPKPTEASVPPVNKDPFADQLDMQRSSEAAQRLTAQQEAQTAAEVAEAKAKRGKQIGNGIAAVATVGSVAAVGIGFGLLASEHADQELNQNVQWKEEADQDQNQQRQQFDEGLDAGKVTIETPAPVDEIPAPQFGDIQLPTKSVEK